VKDYRCRFLTRDLTIMAAPAVSQLARKRVPITHTMGDATHPPRRQAGGYCVTNSRSVADRETMFKAFCSRRTLCIEAVQGNFQNCFTTNPLRGLSVPSNFAAATVNCN
jgi:hypothetical protein